MLKRGTWKTLGKKTIHIQKQIKGPTFSERLKNDYKLSS